MDFAIREYGSKPIKSAVDKVQTEVVGTKCLFVAYISEKARQVHICGALIRKP